jgi:hypothetical protein
MTFVIPNHRAHLLDLVLSAISAYPSVHEQLLARIDGERSS